MAEQPVFNDHLTSSEKWSLEEGIRRERARRKRDDPRNFIPHKDPDRGPTISETMSYYAERTEIENEMRLEMRALGRGHEDRASGEDDDFIFPREGALEELPYQQRALAHQIAAERARRKLEGKPAAAEGGDGGGASAPSPVEGGGGGPGGTRYGGLVEEGGSVVEGSVAAGAGSGAGDTSHELGVPAPNKGRSCALCGWTGTRYRCSRCRAASYCSQACQRNHWQEHSASCVAPPLAIKAAPGTKGKLAS